MSNSDFSLFFFSFMFQFEFWIEMKFLHEFLDMLLNIGFKFQVNHSLVRNYFIGSNLMDESCQNLSIWTFVYFFYYI